jgi:hypothetical protein
MMMMMVNPDQTPIKFRLTYRLLPGVCVMIIYRLSYIINFIFVLILTEAFSAINF